jgi:hypothetical protein
MFASVLSFTGSNNAASSLMMLFCHPRFSNFPDEKWIFYAMQGLVLLGLVRSLIEYRKRRRVLPLLLTILSTSAIIYGLNNMLDTYYIYAGVIGLLIVSVLNSVDNRRRKRV